MAVITSTASDVRLESKYTCYNRKWKRYYHYETLVSSWSENWTSSSTTATTTITFNYTLPSNEPINMVVLQMTQSNNTYGGSLYLNNEGIYLSGGMYTVYLEPSSLGSSSTSFELKFLTYTPSHTHSSSSMTHTSDWGEEWYDSDHVDMWDTFTLQHTGLLNLTDITLKIYAGDDFASAPSTSALFVGVDDVAKKVTDIFVGVDGVARKVSDAWIGINGVARKFWPCLELKDVPPGSIIQLDETGTGTLVDYIVVAQNQYLDETNTEGHTVFMRKNLLTTKSKHGDNTYGENYVNEALDKYVNGTWKATLDGRILMKIMKITIPCTKWTDPYKTTAERQVWVPARGEIDPSFSEKYTAICFPYFETITTNAARIAYDDNGTAQAWWTRSCVEGTNPYVRVVNANGAFSNYSQTNNLGVRPVFCLPNSLPVSLISEGQYDLIL